MSNLSGLGGSAASHYATALQQLQHRLFGKIDANGDGTVSQSELEQAVTQAGGTTTSADALYAALDPSNSGSVSEQQFAQNLPLPAFSPDMGAQLIADQAQMCSGSTGTDPAAAFKQKLFSEIDANGDGSLTKSELEQAVAKAGGTTASADALYAKLDPADTGSVSAQQFVQNLPGPHHHHHHGGGDATAAAASASGAAASTDSGSSAEDALMALLDSLVQQPTLASNPFDPSTQTSTPSTDATAASTGAGTAQAAVQALLDDIAPSSQTATASTSGSSADDALLALLNADGSNASTPTSAASAASPTAATASQASTPASLFSKVSQQILALMLQIQAQGVAG